MPHAPFVLGLDFGTSSVRALIADLRSGNEIACGEARYPSGDDGVIGDARIPTLARQNPRDYDDALTRATRAALRAAARAVRRFQPDAVVGIGVDATASTPLPVDVHAVPLAFSPRFSRHPDALAWLWKDHTSHAEADELTHAARRLAPLALERCAGGAYSSEWFWAKALRCRRVAPSVFRAAASWVELCDYIPARLTACPAAGRIPRSVCAAGHKGLYLPPDGWPPVELLRSLHPDLVRLRSTLPPTATSADRPAGPLSPHWAKRLGLLAGTPVAVGMIDAHAGAVGAGVRPGRLVKIIGTSSCDMMVVPGEDDLDTIPGVCGVVMGSILPGAWGIEAGQPAVGDLLNWFVHAFADGERAHLRLSRQAATLSPGASGLVALDWNNGNRSILADPRLTGLLIGQTLQTTAAEVYRALLEAAAFGARVIVEQLDESGARVHEIVACGGIAEKNALAMQIYADVTGRPIRVSRSSQTCALGAAIFGAVAAGTARGGHASVQAAQRAMCGLRADVYRPRRAARPVYDRLFAVYRRLHDAFSAAGTREPLADVMKELARVRDAARRSAQRPGPTPATAGR